MVPQLTRNLSSFRKQTKKESQRLQVPSALNLVGNLAVGTGDATAAAEEVIAGGPINVILIPGPGPQHRHSNAWADARQKVVEQRTLAQTIRILAEHADTTKGTTET